MPDVTHHLLTVTTDDRPDRSGLARWLKVGLRRYGVRAGLLRALPDPKAWAARCTEVRPVDGAMRYEVWLVAPDGQEALVAVTWLDRGAEGLRLTLAGAVEGIVRAVLEEVLAGADGV